MHEMSPLIAILVVGLGLAFVMGTGNIFGDLIVLLLIFAGPLILFLCIVFHA